MDNPLLFLLKTIPEYASLLDALKARKSAAVTGIHLIGQRQPGTRNAVIGLAIGQPPAPATSSTNVIGQRRQLTNRHHQRAVSQSRRPTHQHQQRHQPSHHQRHQRQRPLMPTGTLKPSALSDPKRRQRSQPSQRHRHKSALIHRNVIALRLTRIHLARPANLGHRVVQHFAVLRNPARDAAEREQRREHGRVETNRAVN